MYGYIYLTYCSKTNKYYIGQHKFQNNFKYDSNNHVTGFSFFDEEGNQKFKIDKRYLGSGKLLKQAIKKYGEKYFYILNILDVGYTKEELDDLEIQYIKEYKDLGYQLYNILPGGNSYKSVKGGSSNKGKTPWNKGLKNCYSKETLEKWSKTRKKKIGELSPQYGLKRSDETKINISNKKKKLINEGWKPWQTNKIKVNKNNKEEYIEVKDLFRYLNNGYIISSSTRRRLRKNHNIIIPIEKIHSFTENKRIN